MNSSTKRHRVHQTMAMSSSSLSSPVRSSIPLFVIKATAITSLGGILFGYDLGVISCALPQVTNEFDLTASQQEWVVSILYLGGVVGAALGGFLCDGVGRKTAIFWTDLLFMIGAAILYYSPDVALLLIGRFVVGFAVSVSGIADVSYLHEIAPIQWRGSIVSVNEACISLGFLLAFASGVIFDGLSSGWRYMFGISGWLALIQLLGMTFMPESPVWLKQKGRDQERKQALHMIYGAIPGEIIEVIDSAEIDGTEDAKGVAKSPSLEPLGVVPFTVKDALDDSENSGVVATSQSRLDRITLAFRVLARYRRQAWIALFLAVTQQLSGQAAVLSYAPVIFDSLDHPDRFATVWIGVVKFCVTVLVIWRIEHMGRRFLLQFGMLTIGLGQFCIALAFSMSKDGEQSPSWVMLLALPGVLLVTLGYSASFGPLSWLLTSEIFPAHIRGRALGASTIVTYLFASLVTSTFLSLQSKVGSTAVFFMYGLTAVLGTMFANVAIPDTGNKTEDEIDELLNQMWWWRKGRRGHLLINEPVGVSTPLPKAAQSDETELTLT